MLGVAGQLLLAHRKPARADRVTFLERNARTPPNHKARILRTNFSELFSGHGAHDSHQISDLERVASGEHEVYNASHRAVPAANTGAVYAVKACKSETQRLGDGTVRTDKTSNGASSQGEGEQGQPSAGRSLLPAFPCGASGCELPRQQRPEQWGWRRRGRLPFEHTVPQSGTTASERTQQNRTAKTSRPFMPHHTQW